jgi:hypothetical protein
MAARCRVRNRGAFRQQRIGKTPAFERIIGVKSRVKEKVAFSFFTDDKAGLIVADFDNV